MANPQTPYTKDSEQRILNKSFDPAFDVLATESLNYNGTALVRSPAPFLTKPFDEVVITYTDSSKGTIDTIETKLSGVTQETISYTSASTTDTYTRS